MKYGIKLLTALLLLTFASQIRAQDENAEGTTEPIERYTVLIMSGEVYDEKGDPMKDVQIRLYEQNEVVTSMETRKKGNFKFQLLNDYIYTLEISQNGYITKRVTINTAMPGDDGVLYEFILEVPLEPLDGNEVADELLLEYPYTIVQYDQGKENFVMNEEYTRGLVKELREARAR